MRAPIFVILVAGLVGCGGASAGTSADASGADTLSDVGTGDTASDDAQKVDGNATDAVDAAADTSSADATTSEIISSDSPWKGALWVNEIHAGGSKTPTVAEDADWIELYNTGKTEVDLSNCKLGGLTNGLAGANPVPVGTKIAAGAFVPVFYNHMNLGTPVIDAGIKSDGSMGLWDANGLLVDSVDWNEGDSPAGSSFDRVPDGGPVWKTITPPTPGQPNAK